MKKPFLCVKLKHVCCVTYLLQRDVTEPVQSTVQLSQSVQEVFSTFGDSTDSNNYMKIIWQYQDCGAESSEMMSASYHFCFTSNISLQASG